MAEGFDGHIAMQSLTLPVDTTVPDRDDPPSRPRRYALRNPLRRSFPTAELSLARQSA
jgi:hypothetical protein